MQILNNMNYRKLWINTYGPIPVDEDGFSYEIHHIDGNHNNNDIHNLKLVTIKEHLDIHLRQEDWFAASLIAKRLGLGPDYTSNLQAGKKRPGVGGVKKGNIPWNRGKANCFSQETILKFQNTRKGKRYGPPKISDDECRNILHIFNLRPELKLANTKSKNGKIITYERAFAKTYHKKYLITEVQMYNIITGKRHVC